MDLVPAAQKFLVGKAWSSELVLRMGVELLSVAQSIPNLSSQDKISLVCQTILKMLDDVTKAGKEHLAESTGIMPTTAQLEHYKAVVQTALPVTLEIASIRLPAQCVPHAGCLPILRLPRFSWGCMRKQIAETVSSVEDVLKHPQEYLEEMRDLVSKVEKLVSVAAQPLAAPAPAPVPEPAPAPVPVPVPEPAPAPAPAPVAEPLPEPVPLALPEQTPAVSTFAAAAEPLLVPRLQLPPSPELSAEQLPGGLATPEEVVLSQ